MPAWVGRHAPDATAMPRRRNKAPRLRPAGAEAARGLEAGRYGVGSQAPSMKTVTVPWTSRP